MTYYVGTRAFGSRASFGQVARTTGFAYAPGALLVFSFLPLVGPIIRVVAALWQLLAVYVALNLALEVNPLSTLATVTVSILPRLALGFIIGWTLSLGYL